MSRSKRPSTGSAKGKRMVSDNYGVDFVNITLSSDDKAHLREWAVSPEEMWLELERLAQNGYKVSVSVDMENTGGIVAITGKRGCVPTTNEGRCLVSRGPDVGGAMLSALYKLQAYCVDGHFPDVIAPNDPDFS